MKRRYLLGVLLLPCLFSSLLALGCAGANSEASQAPRAKENPQSASAGDDAIPVSVDSVGRGRIEAVLRYSTNLEAENQVAVHSQAARQVRELLVEEGDSVAFGQVLLRLQDDEQTSALAKVRSQLAKARREYDRQKKLFSQDLISEQAFSEATYNLEQLEIALQDAERELGYTEVRAPISGRITQRRVNLGDQVMINDHLFDIVDFDSIVARIYVPEKELRRLRPGQPGRILAQALGSELHRGRIERIAPTVDPRSGTVKVTLAIPRSEGLVPGMYVEVELVAEVVDQAVLVPKRALVFDQDQIFLFRLAPPAQEAQESERHQVERLLIEPLLEDPEFVQVGASVKEGDRIVVAGQAGLKDGALVRLLPSPGEVGGEESPSYQPSR